MNRPMNDPRLVIVGAGVAGLAAGCYAVRRKDGARFSY